MKQRALWLTALLPLLSPVLTAAAPSLEPGAAASSYTAFQARVAICTARERVAHGGDTNWFVRHGVVASVAAHSVWVYGRATGIKPSDPVEFTLITTNSGHDYEALITAFASASDLADALRFVGMPEGLPVNYEQPRFWPKGERVRMTVERFEGDNPTGRIVRVDALGRFLFDTRAGHALPTLNWVYVGPNRMPDPAATGRLACAADVAGPQAIGALYNEYSALFDLPRLALQGEVYGSIAPNHQALLEPGAVVRVRIEPEYTDGRRRVCNLGLAVMPATNTAVVSEALVFELHSEDMSVVTNGERQAILAAFGRLTEAGRDPFVSVKFDDALTVSNAHSAAVWLASIEGEHGIRIEPPPPDGLFFRSLIPYERTRRRANRPQQPLELHARIKDGRLDVGLVTIDEHWTEGAEQAELTVTSAPVSHPADLVKALAARPQPNVLLIFTDPEVTIRQLRPYLAAARPTHPTLHIYMGDPQ